MSYLKIFPRSLVAKVNAQGAYQGRMTYDFEQYGHMLHGNEAGVELEYQLLVCSGWSIRLTDVEQSSAGLSVFIQALNYYLFNVLQFDPASHWRKLSDKDYEFYFERVYFDMDTQQFIPVKKTSAAGSTGGVGGF